MVTAAVLASLICVAHNPVVQQSARPVQYVLLTNEPKERQPDTSVPLMSAADLSKRYVSETYYIEKGESGRYVVIDKRLWQIEQELDALSFLTEMFKRPNPFAAVQLGQLSQESRDVALRLMYVNETKKQWAQGQEEEDIGVALGMTMIVRLVGRDRNGAVVLPAQLSPDAQSMLDQGLAQWALKYKVFQEGTFPTEQPDEPMGQIKFLFFCDIPEHPAAMEEASEIFHRYVVEVKRQSATAIEGQYELLQQAFQGQLGRLGLPPSTDFNNWPEDLRDTVTRSLRASWRGAGFASRDEVDAFLLTVQGVKLMMSFNITFFTKLGDRPPAKTGLEVYRTG